MTIFRAFSFADYIKIIFAFASIHFQFNFTFTKHTTIDILPFPVRLDYSTLKSYKMKSVQPNLNYIEFLICITILISIYILT